MLLLVIYLKAADFSCIRNGYADAGYSVWVVQILQYDDSTVHDQPQWTRTDQWVVGNPHIPASSSPLVHSSLSSFQTNLKKNPTDIPTDLPTVLPNSRSNAAYWNQANPGSVPGIDSTKRSLNIDTSAVPKWRIIYLSVVKQLVTNRSQPEL